MEQETLQDAVEILRVAETDLQERGVQFPARQFLVPGQGDHVPDPGDVVVDDRNDLRWRAGAVLGQVGEEAFAPVHAVLQVCSVVHAS